jgi:predicted PurR-regulated permease PerM
MPNPRSVPPSRPAQAHPSDARALPRDGAPCPSDETHPWLTRERINVWILVAVTLMALAGCALVVWPFIAALTWALALGVLLEPIHARLAARIRWPIVSAGLCVVGAALLLIGPATALANAAAQQLGDLTAGADLQSGARSWQDMLTRIPMGTSIVEWVNGHVNLEQQWQQAIQGLATRITSVVTGTVWVGAQFLVMLFVLFYFLRDARPALTTLRRYSPLSERETDQVFDDVVAMIYATVYGTLTVSAIQGCLGGLMFWWLGVPAPILWGLVMALLSLFPMAGSFLVWFPTAAWFALQGEWTSAIVLVVWGATVIGLIDNLLYPLLVGREMRLHTLPVFFSIVGGVLTIGASGLILGPVLLAVTTTLLGVWRARTVAGRPAEIPQT